MRRYSRALTSQLKSFVMPRRRSAANSSGACRSICAARRTSHRRWYASYCSNTNPQPSADSGGSTVSRRPPVLRTMGTVP